ncbi:PEP-CTERM sorting domain-containing protein [Neorhodopirellula lusitana]|uniref:PEP-CTERM sorting domain-containing protein n=1 Tax=Neorhodopirellula lusitana TaxID=445327 RepID=UPI00384B0067
MMNSKILLATLSLVAGFLVSSANAAVVVYESFDYTSGDDIVSQNGGIGFDGAWTGAGNSENFDVGSGQSFGSLMTAGGSSARTARNGNGAISRGLSAAAQTQLTADNSTIWFSVLMDPTDAAITDGGGFATNSYGTLIFGDTAFTSASGASAPTNSGNAFGVGFADTSDNSGDFANVQIQGVAYDDGVLDTSSELVVGDVTSFIVGRIDFNADGTDDVMELYNVTDPSLALPATAFATMTADLDQSGFNIISIGDAQTSIFDEIRFGTTLAEVTPVAVPEPSSLALLGLGGLVLFRRRR